MGRNTEYGEFTIVTPYISPTRTAFENATNSNYLYLTSPGNVDAITSPGPSSQNIVSCGGGGAGGQFDTPGILGVDGVPGDYIGIPGSSFGGGGGGHPGGAGGTGGGGNGGASPTNIGSNATANTGGGGGGGVPAGGSGGSGVFFVRYPTSYAAATVTGNTPTPAQSGYYVYRWNSGPGTIIFN
jgi:hypothetical protein